MKKIGKLISVHVIKDLTLLCSNNKIRSCCSTSLLTNVESNVDEQSGGNVGQHGLAPGPHTDKIASWDTVFSQNVTFKMLLGLCCDTGPDLILVLFYFDVMQKISTPVGLNF
jgi:hypothetical protein